MNYALRVYHKLGILATICLYWQEQRWLETLRAYVHYDLARMRNHYQNETHEIETGVIYYQLISKKRGTLLNFYIADNGKRVNL